MALTTTTITEKDLGLDSILKAFKNAGISSIKTGLFDPVEAEKGYINEYGSDAKNIPSRPFMRQTIEKFYREWVLIGEKYIKNKHKPDMDMILLISHRMRTDMVYTIKNGTFQRNSDRTIDLKGSSRPLIDTGAMWNAIESRIEKE